MNFDKVMSGLVSSGVLGGLAGGAVSGALLGKKKARKTAGTLLKVGGVAALGGMAWKAYQRYQAGPGGTGGNEAPGHTSQPAPGALWQGLDEARFFVGTHGGSTALLLIQAMITAACSDGHLDAEERQRILQQVDKSDLAPDEKALVFDALQSPLSLAEICERVDSPELAAEVYMASRLAVDDTRTEGRLYLEALAARLRLPAGLVQQLHLESRAA